MANTREKTMLGCAVRMEDTGMRLVIGAIVLMALAGPAAAQHQHIQTPYAGLHQRAVKALSDQQVADLRAGRGMGLALAGELNRYPGPSHVLVTAEVLTPHQNHRYAELRGYK